MRALTARGRSGPDGVLHLSVPVGTPDQDYEIVLNLYPHMTEGDRQKWIEKMDSLVMDESFFAAFEKDQDQQANP
jgi:hypothetical protein